MYNFISKLNSNNTKSNSKYNCDSIKVERGASLYTESLVEGSASYCDMMLAGVTTHEHECLSSESIRARHLLDSRSRRWDFLESTWSHPSHFSQNLI